MDFPLKKQLRLFGDCNRRKNKMLGWVLENWWYAV